MSDKVSTLTTKYSKVLTSLGAVRMGWWNPTVHPAESYTDEEAEKLIKVVELFVEDYLKLSD